MKSTLCISCGGSGEVLYQMDPDSEVKQVPCDCQYHRAQHMTSEVAKRALEAAVAVIEGISIQRRAA